MASPQGSGIHGIGVDRGKGLCAGGFKSIYGDAISGGGASEWAKVDRCLL